MRETMSEHDPHPTPTARPPERVTSPLVTDLAYVRLAIVNAYLYGARGVGDGGWVLIDAGIPGSAARILRAAADRFGEDARPAAIILTHGHFDHVGAARTLAERWDVPVYAHELELPYLTGRSPYPSPDPTVGGGAMAALSRLYPRGPVDLRPRVRTLPADGSVPGMPGWRWLHTPGHTPGHVSLFRDSDRVLLAGDAVVTTKQESAIAVATQRPEIHAPPAYFTQDWDSARDSVHALAALEPAVIASGHGPPMSGNAELQALQTLARYFDRWGLPPRGRYVRRPAIADERGTVWVPPGAPDPLPKLLLGVGALVAAGVALSVRSRRHEARGRTAARDGGVRRRITDGG